MKRDPPEAVRTKHSKQDRETGTDRRAGRLSLKIYCKVLVFSNFSCCAPA